MPDKTLYILLNAVSGLGPVRIKHLLDTFGSPEAVLQEPTDIVARVAGCPVDVARQVRSARLLDHARRQEELAARNDALVLTLADPRYPANLREIYAPPPVLFVKGHLEAFSVNAVAIVGMRLPTSYGRRAAETLSRDLASGGITIVSGLALGIDTVAHRGCLAAGGRTVAVLGSGIDHIYPSENRRLATEILEQGALVSEFPLATRPFRHNFPRRNRVISGLSAGAVIVEAARRSGSLITSSYALQQGREVFAVPGSIFSPASEGAFNLIRSGATPVRTAADITDTIQSITLKPPAPIAPRMAFPPELLSETERTVLETLTHTPVRFDELQPQTGLTVNELLGVMLNLELKGLVRQVVGQAYVKG